MASETTEQTAGVESDRALPEGKGSTRRVVIRKLSIAGGLMAILPLVESSISPAVAQAAHAPVNIVYPIDGATYPSVDIVPHGVVASYYQSASFSVTCGGGP